MIVQHNIMAINSHRQLGINNTNLAKNLEKLSSGYRINRAADDAAGLAISEKMRAQITGLNRAVMNAEDGKSLIQTAEGALQEVHSMLNRMVELATQSANGTIQADDRQKIEAEVTALKEEIDRISQSTNFNGIKLLDGSLSNNAPKDVTVQGVKVSETPAVAGAYGYTFADIEDLNVGDQLDFTVSLNNGESYTMRFEVTEDGESLRSLDDGTIFKLDTEATAGAADGEILGDTIADMVETQLSKTEFANDFIVGVDAPDSAVLNLTNRVAGTKAPQITGISRTVNNAPAVQVAQIAMSAADDDAYMSPADDVRTIREGSFTIFEVQDNLTNEDEAIFTVNGEKFVLVHADDLGGGEDDGVAGNAYADYVAELRNRGVNIINVSTVQGDDAGDLTEDDLIHIAADINHKTGLAMRVNEDGDGIIVQAPKVGNGLTMQVGDTNDAWNKITVSVDDMSSAGLGISNISMATQEAAANALEKINKAIEKVSVNRGNLGALQNRLEYTINNLNVTSENMTAAESRIRDVDMAKEMMQFTKNNVLSQAAQAMLAQANMQPQNVLQLLR